MPNDNNGGTDLDELLAGTDPSGGTPDPNTGGGEAPGSGDGGTGGGDHGSSVAEVDLGTGFGKVKLADLKAAWGRNKQNSQSAAKLNKYQQLMAKMETDPSLHDDIMEALASRDEDASSKSSRQGTPPEDGDDDEGAKPDKALLQTNPVEYIRRMESYFETRLFEQQEKLADQSLDREERELRTEHKLDDKSIREIQRVCLQYRDAKGDPIPMKLGFAIWNNPKLLQEQANLKTQINARSSGIPGGRSSGILSRKKVSEMSETEREQAMVDEFYAAESKGQR